MRQMFIAILALGLLVWVGNAQGQETDGAAETETTAQADASAETSEEKAWWEEEEESGVRGYIGGLLAAGFGVNGQIDTGLEPYVDTSVLFALRGGLLLGKGNRWLLGFEVAPATNRLDWRRSATVTGFVSFGSLVSIRNSKQWSWLWKVGVGVGGGLDWRFLVGVQLDVLTFNYKMSDRLWVDFGIPTMRFHIETAAQARYNAQFVFPFGITFAI